MRRDGWSYPSAWCLATTRKSDKCESNKPHRVRLRLGHRKADRPHALELDRVAERITLPRTLRNMRASPAASRSSLLRTVDATARAGSRQRLWHMRARKPRALVR